MYLMVKYGAKKRLSDRIRDHRKIQASTWSVVDICKTRLHEEIKNTALAIKPKAKLKKLSQQTNSET